MEIPPSIASRARLSALTRRLFREIAQDYRLHERNAQLQRAQERARLEQRFVRRTDFLARGAEVDFLRPRPQERDEQTHRQRRADPDNSVVLKGALQLEREIKLVAQRPQVAHDQL